MSTTTVTATEWGLSFAQTSGDPDRPYSRTTLSVHRLVPGRNHWGGEGRFVHHWAHGFEFESPEAARAFALAIGLIRPSRPGTWNVDPADEDAIRAIEADQRARAEARHDAARELVSA